MTSKYDDNTPLERALIAVSDTRGRSRRVLPSVMHLTWDQVPDDWLPWVIEDEALDELLPFLPAKDMLIQGRLWARERGSSQAIARALGWLDLTATLHYEPDEDENFDLFQIELLQPVTTDQLPDVVRLAEISKPTTDILARIFSGYDARPFRLDHSRLDGPDLLDDWSGVRLPETGDVVVSFGIAEIGEAAFEPVITGSFVTHMLAGKTEIREGFVLDESRLDDEIVEPPVLAIETIERAVTLSEADLSQAPWEQPAPWPSDAWRDFNITIDGGWIASDTTE